MVVVELETNPGTLVTRYRVFVDRQEFCVTENDDVGFELLVASNEIGYRRAEGKVSK